MTTVVVTHQDCMDGLAALWLFTNKHAKYLSHTGELEVHNCQYGDPARELVKKLYSDKTHREDHLYLLDFSFFGKELEWLCYEFKTVTVLDHHASALDELSAYFHKKDMPYNLTLKIDTERSGCKLTYDYFNELKPLHQLEYNWIIEAVNDRDLWRFDNPNTKDMVAYLTSYPMTVESWDEVYGRGIPEYEIISSGQAIRRQLTRQLEWHYTYGLRHVSFGVHDVVAVNAPRYNASDLADYILTRMPELPFVIVWYQDKDVFHYSLRSKNRTDVSVIAHSMGGGGHKNAASFRLTEPLVL